ncbi:MAG: hypothetical protein Kow0031_10970 [Anaerolineae bacterium]
MTVFSVIHQGKHYPADDIMAWPWAQRTILGLGGFGVVYRLGGLAVKVGRIDPDEITAQRHFARDCERELGRVWDARPANVARYKGRLIALDMGNPFPFQQ